MLHDNIAISVAWFAPTMIAPEVRHVDLVGFPLIITTVIYALLPFAVISVAIRTFVRVRDGGFGLDDGLLLAGLVSEKRKKKT